jgi:hypothetical protein
MGVGTCNEPLYLPPPKAGLVMIISLGPSVKVVTAGR